MQGFTGKCAVVTGAAQGIGFAIAKKLVECDVSYLAVIDWNQEAVKMASEELTFGNTKVLSLSCDVSNYEMVCERFAYIEDSLAPVDILVNNAGITRDGMFHKMSYENWDAVLKVNLYGVFNCCRAIINGMRDRGYGRIVNIASTSAYGNIGQTNYAATKAGIIGFTKSLAKENARKDITVNAIAPSFVNTPMMNAIPPEKMEMLLKSVPMLRMGEPYEVAALAAFLCSSEASYVNGTCIDCSGAERT